MSSSFQVSSGVGGGGRPPHPLLAALELLAAANDVVLSTSVVSLTAEQVGQALEVLGREIARTNAGLLRLVRQAEACDVGKLTGAPNAAVYLRTALRMSRHESSAVVGLARDLDIAVPSTGEALARGAVSVRQAQVIADAVKKLPDYVGPEERVEAGGFLIGKARFHNPDELRVLGTKLLERVAPEEYYRQLGEELARKDRTAEQKRSLRYSPNGVPQSESVHISLPVWEMELLRKLIEPLAEPVKGADPDRRPIDQRRGDAFAELLSLLAAAAQAPVRGGRPPQVAVTIPLEALLKGTGAGTVDDTATVVRPRPCTCPCTDPKYAKQSTKKPAEAGGRTAGDQGGAGGPEAQAGKEKRRPPGTGAAADGIPPPREPGQHPQPHSEPEPGPGATTGRVPATGPEPATGPDPEGTADPAAGPEADAAPEGVAGPEAAVDPHDGCPACGGGGSARYLGVDGKPISVATVRRLACEADLIPVVLGGDGQVLDLGRSDRFFKEHQRRALAIRDGHHCNFPGCQIPEPRCVTHHMKPWDRGGPTDLANGVLLCRYHHVTVHHKGWQVRVGSHGRPEYVPPEWSDPKRRILRP
ncbi:HNH endonuclease signature motif containing protein [Actinopolymorpha singaporensis]|uniref:HNH endonuclease n=1 Tax=Actinopolymorpha singaporensis TaxID=117157 RepID=A0A1H1WK66_9ACTN|nr:HNH endonuclease signature motif containing protein [Actinopolymorpha singaporensis]SDS97543.1 HNH endonuclease [Actinopolymorpha singaporensis]